MKFLPVLWKSGFMGPCACVIPYRFSSLKYQGITVLWAVFSTSHRSPMLFIYPVLASDRTLFPDPLMKALSHSSTFMSMLKTLHPPVTYRVSLMPARRPAHPFPRFSMMLHNKPAIDYKTPQNPMGNATRKPCSRATQGFCVGHGQDIERPCGLWQEEAEGFVPIPWEKLC